MNWTNVLAFSLHYTTVSRSEYLTGKFNGHSCSCKQSVKRAFKVSHGRRKVFVTFFQLKTAILQVGIQENAVIRMIHVIFANKHTIFLWNPSSINANRTGVGRRERESSTPARNFHSTAASSYQPQDRGRQLIKLSAWDFRCFLRVLCELRS